MRRGSRVLVLSAFSVAIVASACSGPIARESLVDAVVEIMGEETLPVSTTVGSVFGSDVREVCLYNGYPDEAQLQEINWFRRANIQYDWDSSEYVYAFSISDSRVTVSRLHWKDRILDLNFSLSGICYPSEMVVCLVRWEGYADRANTGADSELQGYRINFESEACEG